MKNDMEKNTRQGIIYCRVSSHEQVQGTSLENQKRACLEYAENKGIKVVQIFIEKGESATAANRTEFLKALQYCRAYKDVSAFIVWKIDRFARNTTDHFAVRAKLTQYGVTLQSVTEPITQDHIGKLMETFLAGYAEFENDVRKQRCTEGMQAKIREGIWPWHPPIGYIHSKKRGDRRKTKPDEPDPERFYLAQKALRTFKTGTYSMTEITEMMNQWGFMTRTGKPMRIQLVDKMLSDKYYAGILVDPWMGEEYPAQHKPMITPEEYYQIQLVKAGYSNHTNRPHRSANPDFPLRRFVGCVCGQKLTGAWSKGRNKRYAYYYCKNRSCVYFGRSLSKKVIEDQFIALLERITPQERFLQVFESTVLHAWRNRHMAAKQERQHYETEVKRIETRKEQVIQMRMNGEITKDEFMRLKDGLEMRITALTISQNEAMANELDIEAALTYAVQFLRNLARQWQDMDIKQKQRLQKLVLPEGIGYDKAIGEFRTAILSPIFELNQRFEAGNSDLVAWIGQNLNRLLTSIQEFMMLGNEMGYGKLAA